MNVSDCDSKFLGYFSNTLWSKFGFFSSYLDDNGLLELISNTFQEGGSTVYLDSGPPNLYYRSKLNLAWTSITMRIEVANSKITLSCERVWLVANHRNDSQCHVLECGCEEGFECERVLDRCEQLRLVVGYDWARLIANGRNLSYGFGDRCDPSNRSGVWFAFASDSMWGRVHLRGGEWMWRLSWYQWDIWMRMMSWLRLTMMRRMLAIPRNIDAWWMWSLGIWGYFTCGIFLGNLEVKMSHFPLPKTQTPKTLHHLSLLLDF